MTHLSNPSFQDNIHREIGFYILYLCSSYLKKIKGTSARSHKSRAAVDYTPIGVEPHGPTRGVWPIVAVANDSQSHLVASSI